MKGEPYFHRIVDVPPRGSGFIKPGQVKVVYADGVRGTIRMRCKTCNIPSSLVISPHRHRRNYPDVMVTPALLRSSIKSNGWYQHKSKWYCSFKCHPDQVYFRNNITLA